MASETVKRIDELVDVLRVNDKKVVSDFNRLPKEPKGAMNELVRTGKPAVKHLLELLNNTSRFSCFYAAKVLGEIGDPSTTQPLLNLCSNDEYVDNLVDLGVFDEHLGAIRKIGLPALEPTLTYLKERTKQGDDWGVYCVTDILVGLKDEKSFNALIDLLPREAAINALVKYGDKRAVEHLRTLLANDNIRDHAAEAIRKLVPIQEYRDLLAPYASKIIERFADNIRENLSHLKYAHLTTMKFEGDNADEFNFIALELKIQESIGDLLRNAFALGSFEGAYSEALQEDLDSKLSDVRSKWWNFKSEHEEEIEMIQQHYPEDAKSTLTKTYKGLASSTYESGPKIDALLVRIKQWLKAQGFSVTSYGNNLWVRKGVRGSRQGCFISAGSDYDRPRTWGTVHLGVWGNGWTKKDAKKFSTSFWEFSEAAIRELIGKKKFESQTVKVE